VRGQKLGLAVGLVAGVGLTLGVLGLLAVVGAGSDSKRTVPARPAPPRPIVHTLRYGDVARRPPAAVSCQASGEAGRPNLFCTRIGGGRFEFVFYDDAVVVWTDPDHAQSFNWKP
jgi:hypothetical protein